MAGTRPVSRRSAGSRWRWRRCGNATRRPAARRATKCIRTRWLGSGRRWRVAEVVPRSGSRAAGRRSGICTRSCFRSCASPSLRLAARHVLLRSSRMIVCGAAWWWVGAELEDSIELVGVAVGLGELNLPGTDVERGSFSVAGGFDFDEAVPAALFVRMDVVTEVVPYRLGNLLDISCQMVFPCLLEPCSFVRHDQDLASIAERLVLGFLLHVVDWLRAVPRHDVLRGKLCSGEAGFGRVDSNVQNVGRRG